MARKKKVKKEPSDLDVLLEGAGVGSLSEQPEVMVVPTEFVGLNRATRLGGVPVSCIMLVYGPSQGGKTAFILGLVKSFQRQGHMACIVDAEHTLDVPWAISCDIDPSLPYFRPDTYQEARLKVQRIFKNFIEGRNKGRFHPDRALILVVDSVSKLVPKQEAAKKDIDKTFPLRALFNTIWMDQITPIIHKYPILLVLVTHEKKKLEAEKWEDDKRHKGGDGLYYDSSVVVRIFTRKVIRQKDKKADKKTDKKVEVGILHEGFVEKNKLGVCRENFQFIMSTGRGPVPVGFDLVREVMAEAQIRDKRSPLIRRSGGVWVYEGFPDGKLNSDPTCRAYLRDNPEVLEAVVKDMNARALEVLSTTGEDEGEEDGGDGEE